MRSSHFQTTPGLLAEALEAEIPEIENASVTTWINPFYQSLREAVTPLFMVLRPDESRYIMVRLEAGKEKSTMKLLTRFYSAFSPGFTFDYKFQDLEYTRLYAAEQRVAFLSGCFAVVAVLISCLGLFGLIAFTAERRRKEMAIRKALGSSSGNIVLLLTRDFTQLVLVSIVLSLPLSYWLLQKWLQGFAFHIELTPWYFKCGSNCYAYCLAYGGLPGISGSEW